MGSETVGLITIGTPIERHDRDSNVTPTAAQTSHMRSGLGTVGAAVGAAVVFGERLTAWSVVGMALVVVGVLVMNLLGGASHG